MPSAGADGAGEGCFSPREVVIGPGRRRSTGQRTNRLSPEAGWRGLGEWAPRLGCPALAWAEAPGSRSFGSLRRVPSPGSSGGKKPVSASSLQRGLGVEGPEPSSQSSGMRGHTQSQPASPASPARHPARRVEPPGVDPRSQVRRRGSRCASGRGPPGTGLPTPPPGSWASGRRGRSLSWSPGMRRDQVAGRKGPGHLGTSHTCVIYVTQGASPPARRARSGPGVTDPRRQSVLRTAAKTPAPSQARKAHPTSPVRGHGEPRFG